MKLKKIVAMLMLFIVVFSLGGCGVTDTIFESTTSSEASTTSETTETIFGDSYTASQSTTWGSEFASSTNTSIPEFFTLDTAFSERDLEQSYDSSQAQYITLVSGQDIEITEEGIYVFTGNVENTMIHVNVEDSEKVQIVLNGVTISNDIQPAIFVETADKVFITTTNTTNTLEVTGSYETYGDTNLDAVIFSKSDLVLNGLGTLNVESLYGNGISSKDDLKITGGNYVIASSEDAIEANDTIRIADGTITINTEKDGIHAENDEDSTLGNIYIAGGEITINAGDDGIQGNGFVQIDGGTIQIPQSVEGIEGTYIQINEGDITVYATDDGINASEKSVYAVMLQVNGGTMDVSVGSGDTDAFDSNGNIEINGGVIKVTANSAFDPNGTATLNGGTVYVNGEQITEIIVEQMGGMGGMGGQMPGGGKRR